MSFLETLLGAAKEASDKANNRMLNMKIDVERYENQYQDLPDEQLKRMFKSASGARKIACGRLLRERGYGSND